MSKVISFSATNQSRESCVSPESLLPLLSRVKNLWPEKYEVIIKIICIYANENPVNLKRGK